jgi:hypothetical protein
VAVAGCSDGGAAPQSLPPVTSSPTVTATASPTATATADNLQQSAEQFVRTYYRQFDRANRGSDPSLLDDFYHPNCRACKYNLNVLQEADRRGQHVEGYEHELIKLEPGEMHGNTLAVTVQLRARDGRLVRDVDGSLVRNLPATKAVRTDLVLARTANSWLIFEIVPLGEVKS